MLVRILRCRQPASVWIHLERLASFFQTSTPQAKRRRIIFECLMCFGLPLVYIALRTFALSLSIASTQVYVMFGRPDRSTAPIRFILWLWLSTCYLPCRRYHLSCRGPPTCTDSRDIRLRWYVLSSLSLKFETLHLYTTTGISWRHLVHGVRFDGKRSSISSLTRNLYLRLIGMALLEALSSAILAVVVMWVVLSPGLAPIGNMSRDLSQIPIWDAEAITNTVRTVLEIEWSVTVVRSVAFFGLFACRMEVVCEGWELVRSFMQLLRRSNPSVMFGRGISEQPQIKYAAVIDRDLPLLICRLLAPLCRPSQLRRSVCRWLFSPPARSLHTVSR